MKISNRINVEESNVVNFVANCSIEDAFNMFIQVKENENLATRTISDHKNHFRYFKTFIYQKKPHLKFITDIKHKDIQDYITFMKYGKKAWDNHPQIKEKNNRGLQAGTINVRLRTLKTQFNFWYKTGLINQNPSAKINLLKTDKHINKITAEHLTRLLAQPDRFNKFTDLRDYVVLLLLIDTGCRISPLLSVKMEHVNIVEQELILPLGKNRKEVKISFTGETKKWLNILMKQNIEMGMDKGFLFVSMQGNQLTSDAFRKRLKNYMNKAGIEVNLSPHKFRHYFATDFMKNGGNINDLSQLLQHSSIEATQIYVTNDYERQKKIHSEMSPLSKIIN